MRAPRWTRHSENSISRENHRSTFVDKCLDVHCHSLAKWQSISSGNRGGFAHCRNRGSEKDILEAETRHLHSAVVLENANPGRILLVSLQITCAHSIYINLICRAVCGLPAGILHSVVLHFIKIAFLGFVGSIGGRMCRLGRKLLSKLLICEKSFFPGSRIP